MKKTKYALSKKARYFIVSLLRKFSSPECFEWGCGRSTKYFLDNCPHISQWVAIENDNDWLEYLRSEIQSPCLEIKYAPPTLVKHKDEWWDMENNKPLRLADYFSEYINSIKNFNPHIIIIDGRARLQCLEISHDYIRDDGVVVMDDAHRIYRNLPEWSPALKKWNISRINKKLYTFTKKVNEIDEKNTIDFEWGCKSFLDNYPHVKQQWLSVENDIKLQKWNF